MQPVGSFRIAPANACDPNVLYDFIGAAWKDHSRRNLGESWREGRIDQSDYDWTVSRVGLLNDEIVTHVGVWDLKTRIEMAFVRTGGVNLVCTHPQQRGQGLMRRTLEATLAAMHAGGYDLSALLGSAQYAAFGYVPAWPATAYVIKTSRFPATLPDVDVRPFDPDVPENRAVLTPLTNHDHQGSTDTVQRSPLLIGQTPNIPGDEGYFLLDASGAKVGYLLGCSNPSRSEYYISHAAGNPEQVLRVVAAVARQHKCQQIRFARLPYYGPLRRHLRRIIPLASAPPESGDRHWRVRLINLRTTLEQIAPVLERRLAKSCWRDWTGDLLITAPDGQTVVSISNTRVIITGPTRTLHAIDGGHEIAQLILGSEDPYETVAETNIRLRGDAEKLVGILFPCQHPILGDEAF